MARNCGSLSVAQEVRTKQHQQAYDQMRPPRRTQQQQQQASRKTVERHQQKVQQQEENKQQQGHHEQGEQVNSFECSSKQRHGTGVGTRTFAKRSVDRQQQHSAAQDGCLMVLKIGTSTLMTEDCGEMHMNLSNVGKFVDLVCELRARGHAVVVVSSGAVGAGCVTLHLKERPEQLNMKQAVASVGQCRLMRLYEDLFGLREQKVAQLLVSRHDLVHQKSYQNFRSSLRALLSLRVIPVINENDSLATEELRFGDNDTLAAHIAVAVEAQWLFILTDVHCLYDKNPHKHSDARPVALVDRLTDVYAFLSEKDCGGWGTGGMYTKVVASKIATNMGVHVAVAHGRYPHRVLDMFSYVQTYVERRSTRPPSTSLQQQSRRPSVASANSSGKAVATDSEEYNESCLSGALRDNGRTSAGAAIAAPFKNGKRAATPAPAAGAVEPGGDRNAVAADAAGNTRGNTAAATTAITTNEGGAVAGFGKGASGEMPSETQDVTGCGSGSAARSTSSGSRFRSRSSTDDGSLAHRHENAAGKRSASRDGDNACGDNNSSTTAEDPQQTNGITNGAGCKNNNSDLAAEGKRRDEIESFLGVASFARNVEAGAAPCEQRQNPQQPQKCLEAEHDSRGTFHGAALQQQQHRSPEGDLQETKLHSSVMICESLQQMPFVGTIFLANNLMPHKRGDTRRWILSLPVRGKLFVDKGAVEALVQQKKSLFAAGVRHVVGNFTASECVAVYFDTCYAAVPLKSKSCSADSRSKLAPKSSRADVQRRRLRSTNKYSVCSGTANGQSKVTTCCWNGEGAEPGQANSSGIRASDRKREAHCGAFHEAIGTRNTATTERHTTNHGPVVASEHESSASKQQGCSCRTMRENSTENRAGSHEVVSTSLSFPPSSRRGRSCCCMTSASCCCPMQPGEELHTTDCRAATRSTAATTATSTSAACCGIVCATAAVPSTACSDVKVTGDTSVCGVGAAVVAESPTASKSYSAAASVGAVTILPSGDAWGLGGPPETLEIARCISNFSSAELQVIKGKKSSEFTELLGYPVDEEVAHREHIVFTFMNGHEHLKQLCLGLACDNDSG